MSVYQCCNCVSISAAGWPSRSGVVVSERASRNPSQFACVCLSRGVMGMRMGLVEMVATMGR